MAADQNIQSKMTLKLLGVVVGMFVFGFALVPLYEVYCQVTGANGKTAGPYTASVPLEVDKNRWVTVHFLANNNANMPWEFRPTVRTMKVQPGQAYSTVFFASNPSRQTMMAQAIPSVAPFHAAEYFHKTECFCFEQQELARGERIEMPLKFIIDPHLPASVETLTLSYTLFDITQVADSTVTEPPVS